MLRYVEGYSTWVKSLMSFVVLNPRFTETVGFRVDLCFRKFAKVDLIPI